MRLAPLVFVLFAATCASRPPEPFAGTMVYSCGEQRLTPLGEFGVAQWHLYWFTDLEDGQHIQLGYRIDPKPEAGDEVRLFKALGDQPELLIRFSPRFESWNWLRGAPDKRIATARIGVGTRSEALSPSLDVNFNALDLFANEGDLELTMRDERGAVLQIMTVPRAKLLAIEERLRDLQARYLANLADKPNRCRLEPEPLVLVS